ncbi:hypothetical protein EX30DRAFT_373087 [Ascodesmis nigricans]|uniref:Uncharacterized protein n=1 Tax=Ascodesmis nigricans TaxID=341454 RepID=A0A4S2MS66_9PEZI|nr:hypothetical protein EX30DRAFT_373087 [Ascodesmis nigricans]
MPPTHFRRTLPTRITAWDILSGRVERGGFIYPSTVTPNGEVRIRGSTRAQSISQVLDRRTRMPRGWERWCCVDDEELGALVSESDQGKGEDGGKREARQEEEEEARSKKRKHRAETHQRDSKIPKIMPDAGIMTALHTVAADHYWAEGQEEMMLGAFDESALMCLAILLEEQGKESIGESGYKVLEEFDDPFSSESSDDESAKSRKRVPVDDDDDEDNYGGEGEGAVLVG